MHFPPLPHLPHPSCSDNQSYLLVIPAISLAPCFLTCSIVM
jgi:hypothetical protein